MIQQCMVKHVFVDRSSRATQAIPRHHLCFRKLGPTAFVSKWPIAYALTGERVPCGTFLVATNNEPKTATLTYHVSSLNIAGIENNRRQFIGFRELFVDWLWIQWKQANDQYTVYTRWLKGGKGKHIPRRPVRLVSTVRDMHCNKQTHKRGNCSVLMNLAI